MSEYHEDGDFSHGIDSGAESEEDLMPEPAEQVEMVELPEKWMAIIPFDNYQCRLIIEGKTQDKLLDFVRKLGNAGILKEPRPGIFEVRE